MANLQRKHHSFFFLAIQQGTSVIANHLQVEAAIHMVISTVPNMPYDSALMISLRSNVSHEKSKYSSPSTVLFCPALMALNDKCFLHKG